jgi:ribosome-binding factor A
MPRGFDRKQRVADLIQKSLAQILLHEMHDERSRLVTVMDVSISKDLSFAKVYVSVLEEEKAKDILLMLNNAAKYIRHALARTVELRIVPELRFYYDDSMAKGYRINSLLNSAMSEPENKKKTDKE